MLVLGKEDYGTDHTDEREQTFLLQGSLWWCPLEGEYEAPSLQ